MSTITNFKVYVSSACSGWLKGRIAIFLVIIGLQFPVFIFAKTITVAEGEKITVAMQLASAGDTIMISPGDYSENLIIDKPLNLIGRGHPHIHGNYQGHVLLITAPRTVVKGLKISESGTHLIDDMACIRVEADSATISNNIITRPLHGIYVKGGSYAIIDNNKIMGRTDLISADRGNGIHLWNSKQNILSNNEISDVRDGIYFSFANSTQVYENHIHHVRYGLHYMYSDDNNFIDNLFENNVAGAALMYSKRINFKKNVFARCRGFRAYGILFQSMDYSAASNNLIIDNSRGIFFDNCNFNDINNNIILDNDLAIQMMGNGEENKVLKNNFVNNLSNLVVDGKNSRTIWSEKAGGNYWSDYEGFDLDGDGIGDVPHKIQNVFQILETKIPEIRFYINSPAAEVLEMAEQALPILELGTEQDLKPMFRPVEFEVPWEKAGQLTLASSSVFATWYLIAGIFPFLFLLYWSRRQRKRL